MAATLYKMTLSTTDHNLVGDIKVRQADDETQVFEVNIIENGVIKSFNGLTPFFCLMAREITGQGVSEEPVKVFDAVNGTLKYTLSANALQMVGRNKAYFSFRKELSNGSWIEQFSTKSFYYTVEKSIYTQPFKDSNYWWTFKELYQQFIKYQESGKISWEEFIEQNRDVLESIDPGGTLLAEIIDARRPSEETPFPKLKERLDASDVEVNAKASKNALAVNPDFFNGTDYEKLSAAFEFGIQNKKSIEITREYVLNTDETIDLGHGGLRNTLTVFGGGKISKQSSGYIFDSSIELTGNLMFKDIRFDGGKDTVLFNANFLNSRPRMIRFNFEGCSFLNMGTIIESNGYIQTIKLKNCDSEGIVSAFIRAGGLINVVLDGVLADNFVGKFIDHRQTGLYPEIYNLVITGGCCFNSFESNVLELGTTRSAKISDSYFEGAPGYVVFKYGSICESVHIDSNVVAGSDTADSFIVWGSDIRNCTSTNNINMNKPVHDFRNIKSGVVTSIGDSKRYPDKKYTDYVVRYINDHSYAVSQQLIDFSGAPGSPFLVSGTVDKGFMGIVKAEEMGKINGTDEFVGSNLATALSLSNGTAANGYVPLFKFSYHGSILYIPLKYYRYGLSWNDLYNAGIVYDSADEGFLPPNGRAGSKLSIDERDNSINGSSLYFTGGSGADVVGASGDILRLRGWSSSANNVDVTIESITESKIIVSGAKLVSEQGTIESRIYNKKYMRSQGKTLKIGRFNYKIRLLRMSSGKITDSFTDVDKGIIGTWNEWNDLILPLHEQAQNDSLSWKYPEYAKDEYNQNIYPQGQKIPDYQLSIGTNYSGKYLLGQAVNNVESWKRIYRGYFSASYADSVASSSGYNEQAWLPVLELR